MLVLAGTGVHCTVYSIHPASPHKGMLIIRQYNDSTKAGPEYQYTGGPGPEVSGFFNHFLGSDPLEEKVDPDALAV